MIAKLERLIGEIGDLNSKLILLVGPSRSGKTQLLRQLSAKINIEPLNVGLELGCRLSATSNPFASAMPWSVVFANSLWMAMLAPLPRTRELQPSALMCVQVSISILSIIFTARHCGLISPCESPQLCNPSNAARSGLVQPFVAAHFAAVVSLIGSAHYRRDLSAILVLEI